MIKILPSNAGGGGSIPGQEAKISHASCVKNRKNLKRRRRRRRRRSNSVTNSVETSKTVQKKNFN